MQGRTRGIAVVVVLAAVVVLVAWLASGKPADAEAGKSVSQDSRGPGPWQPPAFATHDVEAVATEPLPVVAAAEAAPAPSTGRLVVQVTWADGTPAVGVGLTAVFFDVPDPVFDVREQLSDSAGRWEIPDAPPGRAAAYVDRGDSEAGDVRVGESTTIEVEIAAGVQVRGLVVDASDRPVSGASVWIQTGHAGQGLVISRSDDAGRFTLRDVRRHVEIGALAEDRMPSPLVRIDDDGTHVQELTLRLGGPGADLAGRVIDTKAEPIPGAFVLVGPEHGWPPPDTASTLRMSGPPPRRLTTDADGRFAANHIRPGVTPLVVRHPGHSTWVSWVEVAAGPHPALEITLPDSAHVTGVVADAVGRPVAGALISSGNHGSLVDVETTSAIDGRYELKDIAVGALKLVASLEGTGEDRTELQVKSGARLEWNPRLTLGLRIFGRVVDQSGAPLAGHHVDGDSQVSGRPYGVQSDTDAAGRFSLDNCVDQEHDLTVRTPDWMTVVATRPDVRPGPDEVVIRIDPRDRPSAFVTGRVVDPRGGVPELANAGLFDPKTGRGESEPVRADSGDFRVGPLKPGEWTLYVIAPGRPQWGGERLELAANETRDVGTIVLPDAARLFVRLELPSGIGPERIWLAAVSQGNPSGGMLRLSDEAATWVSEPLAGGDYVVLAESASGDEDSTFIVPVRATVHVEEGQDERLEFAVERGVVQQVKVTTRRSPAPPTDASLANVGGAELMRHSVGWGAEGDGTSGDYVSLCARPGTYSIKVESEGQLVLDQVVTLPANFNMAPLIEVEVP